VLMALATILAVKIGFGGFIERKRTTSILAAEQAYQFAMGAEALAGNVLTQDAQSGAQQDTLTEPWAQAPQPIPLRPPNDPEGEPMGMLEGSLEDQSGRFNINNLLKVGQDGKTPDPEALDLFTRLLQSLDIDPKWAQKAQDWLDAVYNSQNPPYLTANWPALSTSELLSLPGFGAEQFQKLAPFITALPIHDARINTCTASGRLLDILTKEYQYTDNPDILIKGRKTGSGCFPDMKTLENTLDPSRLKVFREEASEKSDYFRLTTRVTLGSTEFTLYSLLYRDSQTKRVTPILRSFGTT
jgi:general secretion pathway protein K